MILPECSSGGGDQSPNISLKKEKLYSGYCLRPYVAYKGSHAVDYSKKANVKMRKDGWYLFNKIIYYNVIRLINLVKILNLFFSDFLVYCANISYFHCL